MVMRNTINFLTHIKVSDSYRIANFANIYGMLTLMVLQYYVITSTIYDSLYPPLLGTYIYIRD